MKKEANKQGVLQNVAVSGQKAWEQTSEIIPYIS